MLQLRNNELHSRESHLSEALASAGTRKLHAADLAVLGVGSSRSSDPTPARAMFLAACNGGRVASHRKCE